MLCLLLLILSLCTSKKSLVSAYPRDVLNCLHPAILPFQQLEEQLKPL